MSSQPALAPVPVPEPLPPLDVGKAPVLSTARSYWRFFFFVLFLAALFLPVRYMDPLYRLPQFNRFMALALFALSVDMIWGYTGLLSLGQGLYFGIGAYIMAWSLKLQQAAMAASEAAEPELIKLDRYLLKPGVMTDYMEQCRLPEVPSWIAPLINVWLAIPLAIILPTLLAFAFGFIVFKRRIKGVYFSLITQALVLAVFHLVSNQRPYTGGVDGQTNLAGLDLFGIDFEDAKLMFYLVTGILVFFALVCYFLVNSKFGKILTAIRDNEFRVMALGYNTAMFKTVVFALSGLMAGLAGALFVAANQSAGPQFFSIGESIEVVIFVAVGGRGTLVGAILGALLVNWGKDHINNAFSTWWPVVLGGLFVAVVLFLPEGIVGGVPRFFKFVRLWFQRRPGLSTRWNVVRIGFGLMYWGIVAVLLASSLLVIVTFTSRRALPATPEELFGGVFGSICYWTLVIGALTAFVGQFVCWTAPRDVRGKQFALASVVCLGVFVLLGVLGVPAPLDEFRRVFGLRGFGELRLVVLLGLVLAAALSQVLFALFLRGVAISYKREDIVKSVQGFMALFAAFVATNVLLNCVPSAAGNHPLLGPLLYLLGLAYVGMLLVLPVWFLRLLFKAHECINHPMVGS